MYPYQNAGGKREQFKLLSYTGDHIHYGTRKVYCTENEIINNAENMVNRIPYLTEVNVVAAHGQVIYRAFKPGYILKDIENDG